MKYFKKFKLIKAYLLSFFMIASISCFAEEKEIYQNYMDLRSTYTNTAQNYINLERLTFLVPATRFFWPSTLLEKETGEGNVQVYVDLERLITLVPNARALLSSVLFTAEKKELNRLPPMARAIDIKDLQVGFKQPALKNSGCKGPFNQ